MMISKCDPVLNLAVNAPSKSLSKILILAVDPDDRKAFANTEKFKNLDIAKYNIGIEGVEKVNALYASGTQTHTTYDQIIKMFGENGVTRDYLCRVVGGAGKLNLHVVRLSRRSAEYFECEIPQHRGLE